MIGGSECRSSLLRVRRMKSALSLTGLRHHIPRCALLQRTNAIHMITAPSSTARFRATHTSDKIRPQADANAMAVLADEAEGKQPEEAQAVTQDKIAAVRETIKQQHRDLIAQLELTISSSSSSDNSVSIQSDAVQARDKLRIATTALQEGLIERDVEVRLLLLAAMAGENILLIGPPGTGKSEVGRRLSKLVQGSYFERLLTKFSVPEELFGPLSMHALEQDKYIRQTHGYLPEAEFAFIDEIFKANSSILNTLLTLFNEKLFDNGSQRLQVPLLTAVAASNELPETEELDALFDRFLIRRQVQQVSDTGMSDLLKLSSRRKEQNGSNVAGTAMGLVPMDLQLSQQDIRQCRDRALEEVEVPNAIIDMVIDLRRYLQSKMDPPAYISDRRMVKAIQLLQVAAFCNGRTTVSPYDCMLLQHVFWQQPQQANKIVDWLTEQLKQDDGLKQIRFLLSGLRDRTTKAQESANVKKVAALQQEATTVEDLLVTKYREILELSDGEFSPLIQNLWLGTDDADALATALKPQLDVTKKQAEVLLEEVIRLQVALNEGIDVQALAPLEQQSTQHLPGTMIGQTVAFSGFRDVTWESQIMALGGNISKTTVTRSTTILVVHNLHADPTRKVELAKQYGIKIISRPDFGMMLANAQSQSKSA